MSQASPLGSTSPPSFISTLESHANTLSYSGALWSNGLYSLQFWNTVHKHHPRFLLDQISKPPASTIHVVSCVIFLCFHRRVVVSVLKIVLVAFFVAFLVVEGKLEHPCSILFLFAAADIFKGKNKKMSGGVLGGATTSLALFELMQDYILTQFAMP